MIFTIGHSTRTIEEFLTLLGAHDIRRLADVRAFPRSRRHPHFSRDSLAAALASAGVTYRHVPALGGHRKPRPGSRNTAWRNESFRGYADYMESAEFQQALGEVIAWSEAPPAGQRVAVMCAESLWWQCHRQLIADALVAAGVEVRHITSAAAAAPHVLTSFARTSAGRVSYPGLL